MNSRKIKLALTVGLLNNSPQQQNALQSIKDMMSTFKDDVGGFLGQVRLKNARLNRNHIQETYAMKFEKCTLNVDLILNSTTRTQVVHGFRLQ